VRRAKAPLLLLLLAWLASHSSLAPAPPAMNRHVVIFLPGLYGSALHDRASGALRWPSMREIVFRRRELVVCGTNDGPGQPCESLVAGAVVDKVAIVPKLYEIDVYGETLAKIQAGLGPGVTIRPFAYDWRQELSSQAAALDRMVEEERRQGHRVSIVAHSMGGLVASYYLRYGAQDLATAQEDWAGAAKVEKVVLAGVPYGGSVMSFVDLVEGRKVGPNGAILNAAAYQSFASTYQLLPDAADKVLDENFAPIEAPMLDAATWRQRQWGAFATRGGAGRGVASLEAARRLKALLQQPVAVAPPVRLDVLVVQGEGRRTLERVVWRQSATGRGSVVHDRKTWDATFGRKVSSRVLYADGDAVVTQAAGNLPDAFRDVLAVETMHTRNGHRQLLLDAAVVQRVSGFLRGDAEPDEALRDGTHGSR
jgi:pimeloyl-ACP methyl ester carboxylesterase